MTKKCKKVPIRAKNDKNRRFWHKTYKNRQKVLKIAFFDEKRHFLLVIHPLSNLGRFCTIMDNLRLSNGLKCGRVLFTEKAHHEGEPEKSVYFIGDYIKQKGSHEFGDKQRSFHRTIIEPSHTMM